MASGLVVAHLESLSVVSPVCIECAALSVPHRGDRRAAHANRCRTRWVHVTTDEQCRAFHIRRVLDVACSGDCCARASAVVAVLPGDHKYWEAWEPGARLRAFAAECGGASILVLHAGNVRSAFASASNSFQAPVIELSRSWQSPGQCGMHSDEHRTCTQCLNAIPLESPMGGAHERESVSDDMYDDRCVAHVGCRSFS
eukprot:1977203-Rhodomonas_salina.1